jgi:hypothetical protein
MISMFSTTDAAKFAYIIFSKVIFKDFKLSYDDDDEDELVVE